MFHMQSTYLFKLAVRLCLLYSSFLFPFERPLRRVLLYRTSSPLFTLLAFARERICSSYLRFRFSGYLPKPTLFDETN